MDWMVFPRPISSAKIQLRLWRAENRKIVNKTVAKDQHLTSFLCQNGTHAAPCVSGTTDERPAWPPISHSQTFTQMCWSTFGAKRLFPFGFISATFPKWLGTVRFPVQWTGTCWKILAGDMIGFLHFFFSKPGIRQWYLMYIPENSTTSNPQMVGC